jgi:hypothetical protein
MSISDDGLKQIGDLLLSDSHDVELSAHLGEAVVDMRTKVDEVLSKRIETRSSGMAELADFATELTDVAVAGIHDVRLTASAQDLLTVFVWASVAPALFNPPPNIGLSGGHNRTDIFVR